MASGRYTRFLSERALARTPSPIRALQPLSQIPGMIALSGGVPNPALFPLKELSFQVAGAGSSQSTRLTMDSGLLGQALQYSNSYGLPPLVSHWKKILQTEHASHPYQGENADQLAVMVTTGSQDGLSKCFDLLFNPGDPILIENPSYCGALSALYPLRPQMVPVETTHDGLDPSHLQRILDNWDASRPKPKALYTIPTGQNPSGTTIPLDKRRAIYEIACAHDLLILEDDPYWFLHYREDGDQPASFFSMDEELRVLRFDSLSKVLSSGLRLGFVTGPLELVERMQLDQQVSALHACGVSQALMVSILDSWGVEGFQNHVEGIRQFYRERRDTCHRLATKHLSDLATWTVPSAGMFMWFTCQGIKDTKRMIETAAKEQKVLLVPGQAFRPDDQASSAIRAAFSIATEEQMDTGFQRLRQVILSSQ